MDISIDKNNIFTSVDDDYMVQVNITEKIGLAFAMTTRGWRQFYVCQDDPPLKLMYKCFKEIRDEINKEDNRGS